MISSAFRTIPRRSEASGCIRIDLDCVGGKKMGPKQRARCGTSPSGLQPSAFPLPPEKRPKHGPHGDGDGGGRGPSHGGPVDGGAGGRPGG
jgi:hypothetical protein